MTGALQSLLSASSSPLEETSEDACEDPRTTSVLSSPLLAEAAASRKLGRSERILLSLNTQELELIETFAEKVFGDIPRRRQAALRFFMLFALQELSTNKLSELCEIYRQLLNGRDK